MDSDQGPASASKGGECTYMCAQRNSYAPGGGCGGATSQSQIGQRLTTLLQATPCFEMATWKVPKSPGGKEGCTWTASNFLPGVPVPSCSLSPASPRLFRGTPTSLCVLVPFVQPDDRGTWWRGGSGKACTGAGQQVASAPASLPVLKAAPGSSPAITECPGMPCRQLMVFMWPPASTWRPAPPEAHHTLLLPLVFLHCFTPSGLGVPWELVTCSLRSRLVCAPEPHGLW